MSHMGSTGRKGGTPLHWLYRYVLWDRVEFFNSSLILKRGIIFAPVCIVSPV